jgi:glutamate/tyrosine decarboxylase-like PLP-dependent enzyme
MDPQIDDVRPALDRVHQFAIAHLEALGDFRAATEPTSQQEIRLPPEGVGAVGAVDELIARYGEAFSGSPGPRYWGFVNGGVTPAALAGDWLASALDQNAQLNGDGAAAFIEYEALGMLRELFGLPPTFHGVFVTGGTMANHVGLGIALQRLGAKRSVDVSKSGVVALGPVRIVTGESHSSIAKSAAMLGLGRDAVTEVPRLPGREAVDPRAMAEILQAHRDDALIIVANAGTVLTGDFDDIHALADLGERFGAHLHVDGAFGAFAACSPAHRCLIEGMERGDTVASDGHKFLNVPFDSGFVFARDLEPQIEMFKNVSSYQSPPRLDAKHLIHLSPQNSRRLRALPAWIALRAYGAEGYRAIVERCCRLAASLGERIAASEGFTLIAPIRFNVVAFQLVGSNGDGASAEQTADFLTRIRDDGRVFVTPGNLRGTPCVRLAMVNWSTAERDIDIAMSAFDDCAKKVIDAPSQAAK